MRRKSAAAKVAYPAVLGALALILVYLGSVAPTGNWGIVAMAGVLPAMAVVSVGLKAGFLCWAAVTALAFLLVPDKFCVLLFGMLFGLYPMVKSLIEQLRKKPACRLDTPMGTERWNFSSSSMTSRVTSATNIS